MSNPPNTTIITSLDALAVGRTSSNPFVDVFNDRDPTPQDINYPIQKKWLNTATNDFWELKALPGANGITTAVWVRIGASSSIVETLTGNTGGPVPPDSHNNINVVGDGTYVVTVGTPVNNTLTIELTGEIATSYVEDVGTAVPSGGILNVLGGTGVNTFGSGNTIIINAHGGGLNWELIAINTQLFSNIGYICVSPGGNLAVTLPVASVLGDVVRVAQNGATGWHIVQAAGQQIMVAGILTTLGASGSIASTGLGDSIELVCMVADTIWVALSYEGNLTVT